MQTLQSESAPQNKGQTVTQQEKSSSPQDLGQLRPVPPHWSRWSPRCTHSNMRYDPDAPSGRRRLSLPQQQTRPARLTGRRESIHVEEEASNARSTRKEHFHFTTVPVAAARQNSHISAARDRTRFIESWQDGVDERRNYPRIHF